MKRKMRASKQYEPPLEPVGRLWTPPWMKFIAPSVPAMVITWFRVPKGQRRSTVRAGLLAMAIGFVLMVALLLVILLATLVVRSI